MELDRELLYFKMSLIQAEIEMNAMKAENVQRAMNRKPLAYGYGDFMELINKYKIGYNDFPYYKG